MSKLKLKTKLYFWNLLLVFDQFLNALLGGSPDETLSSRAGKRDSREDCVACYWLCRALHLVDKDHCAKSIQSDRGTRDVIR